jgi:hypothetical protein
MLSDVARRQWIHDNSIDPQWRAIVRYALEINDPWLADLVRRADAGETIIDTTDFSQTLETNEDDSSEEKIHALAEIICRAADESAAANQDRRDPIQVSRNPLRVGVIPL